MNHQTRIYAAAIALQGARTFKTELAGIGKTPQGEEFAKAIAEAALDGIQPTSIAEQVAKAMAGNEAMALQLLEGVEELVKAHVEQHTRTLANGKTVDVRAYETSRTGAMKATTNAHGATFHAMRMKNPEAHENAARMHEEAMKLHGAAHEIHPMDVPEVGQEHAKLRGQHQMAAEYHRGEAQSLRNGAEYSKAADHAQTLGNLASQVGTSAMAHNRHAEAASAHRRAHELNPNAGHDKKAESHEAFATAADAFDKAGESNVKTKAKWDALHQSGEALTATRDAHQQGTPEAHAKAAESHAKAVEAHMELHGAHEASEDGHHGKIAQMHIKAHDYHAKMAKGAEVAKGEGPMTITPTTTDLAKKEGGEALAVEGTPEKKVINGTIEDDMDGKGMTGTIGKAEVRPPGENPHAAPGAVLGIEAMVLAGGGPGNPGNDEVGKAHVGAHTRTQGGKMVQVSAYDTHFKESMKVSGAAHTATSLANTPQSHAAAAAAHMKAADAHRTAAEYAPESWQKKGHIDNAVMHTHYAQAHHAKAKAADIKADTGVDTPKHTAQDIKALENHDDYQGYGYVGHERRSEASDKALAEAASRAGLDKHQLAAWALSAAGRHGMHEPKHEGDHEKMVAHYQRQLTNPKVQKGFGLKEYADDLKGRETGDAGGKGGKA